MCETDHPEIARVHTQQRGSLRADRGRIIVRVGSIGGTHFHETRATLLQHVGDPETAADLYQLAPRHDDVALARQLCQDEQHRGSIVIYHHAGGCSREPAQKRGAMLMTGATLSAFK